MFDGDDDNNNEEALNFSEILFKHMFCITVFFVRLTESGGFRLTESGGFMAHRTRSYHKTCGNEMDSL